MNVTARLARRTANPVAPEPLAETRKQLADAAPDLLEALQAMLSAFSGHSDHTARWANDKARAAIARATGSAT